MGGLQSKLIERSKLVEGTAYINLKNRSFSKAKHVLSRLRSLGVNAQLEYLFEGMIKNGALFTPAIIHGVELEKLPFINNQKNIKNSILPIDLAYKIGVYKGSEITIISPSLADSFFEDIPRSTTIMVDRLINTNVPEIDRYNIWVRLKKIQNLARKNEINTIRIFSKFKKQQVLDLFRTEYGGDFDIITWEEKNKTLVYALKLESTVMIFLFIAMTILVSLCITSGLMIFFGKIKIDMASFWILGMSKKELNKHIFYITNILSLISVLLGILIGLIFLISFDKFGPEILPDIFIERKIPVKISFSSIIVAMIIPYSISLLFSSFSVAQFKKEENYLEQIRTIG